MNMKEFDKLPDITKAKFSILKQRFSSLSFVGKKDLDIRRVWNIFELADAKQKTEEILVFYDKSKSFTSKNFMKNLDEYDDQEKHYYQNPPPSICVLGEDHQLWEIKLSEKPEKIQINLILGLLFNNEYMFEWSHKEGALRVWHHLEEKISPDNLNYLYDTHLKSGMDSNKALQDIEETEKMKKMIDAKENILPKTKKSKKEIDKEIEERLRKMSE